MAASLGSGVAGSRARFSSSVGSSSRSAPALCSMRALAYSSRVQFTSWDSSSCSTTGAGALHREIQPVVRRSSAGAPRREVVRLGNKGSTGPFAPLVILVKNAMGEKEFNKLRGKAISLHSQVIKDFCKQVGVDGKQVQLVVRLAKKNGEWLGFLA